MARYVVTLDTSAAEAAMARLTEATDDFRGLMRDMVALAVQRMVDKAFREQGRPGKPWAPLHESTVARRRKGKKKGRADKILIDTGRLRASVSVAENYEADSHSLSVGSNLIYANVHQFGAEIRRKTPRARKAERILERAGELQSMASRLVEGRRAKPGRMSDRLRKGLEEAARERGDLISTIPARPYLPLDMTQSELRNLEFALVHYLTQRLEGEEGS